MSSRKTRRNAAEAAAPSPPPPMAPIPSSRSRWTFRIVALAFPLVLVIIANVGLYLAGTGVDTSLVIKSRRHESGSVYYLNPLVDLPLCNSDFRGPEPRGFLLPKPTNAFRIVVLGESSVQGYPHSSEVSFPRQLELLLAAQLPDRTVEVLNLGIVGLSSTPLVDIAEQCFESRPDLVVAYLGHNEYYGVGGVATNATTSWAMTQARKFRLIQYLVSLGRASAPAGGDLISKLPKQFRIPESSPLHQTVRETFRRNMSRLAKACVSHGVPLLLCKPVSNLRDQSPIAPEAGRQDDSNAAIQAATALARSGDLETAARDMEALRKARPEDAVVAYRLAQCSEQRKDPRAVEQFRNARDLDECRYRASSSLGEILELVAAEHSGQVFAFDPEPGLIADGDGSTPGARLFLEHVHFSLHGHRVMARLLARQVVSSVLKKDWKPDVDLTDQQCDERLGLIPEDEIAGVGLAWFLSKNPPFNQSLDSATQVALLNDQMKSLLAMQSEDRAKMFLALSEKEKVDDLVDGLGRSYLKQNRFEEALDLFNRSKRRRPWMPNGYVFAAICEASLGDFETAIADLARSEETVMPESAPLLHDKERLTSQLRKSRRQ